MRYPILGPRLAIEFRALDIDILIRAVEIDVFDRCDFARLSILDAYFWEVGRRDEVDVLA